MKGRVAALLMAALLAFYLVVVGWRAVLFVQSGNPIGIILGVALLVLPLIGVWALSRELLFGVRSERLVRQLQADDALPRDDLPVRASGRPERSAADADFPRFQADVEAHPNDWQAWFRLGLAYDAAGDRRRARGAIRTAISLERGRPTA